jgi:hypothetical protein
MYDPNALLQKTKLRIEEAADLLEVTPRTIQRYHAGPHARRPSPRAE